MKYFYGVRNHLLVKWFALVGKLVQYSFKPFDNQRGGSSPASIACVPLKSPTPQPA